jgi:2-hydroxy-3-oxopropionate reductase
MTEPADRIGFIGLGIMGRPMAMRLLSSGRSLTVFTRSRATALEVLGAGAVWANSPKEVAEASDVVITMLPDTLDVEAVLLGEEGVLHGATSGTVVVDMSTIDVAATKRISAELTPRGLDVLDAPVSGGEMGAINGSLSIMVGGPLSAFERVRPIFELLGRSVLRVGGTGAGQVSKACNQLIVASNIEAVSEALSLAAKAGVDPGAVREALLGGFASSRVLEVHGERMLKREFKPGFTVRLHRKDSRIVQSLAVSVGARTPAFDVARDALVRLDDGGAGALDHSALFMLLDGWES